MAIWSLVGFDLVGHLHLEHGKSTEFGSFGSKSMKVWLKMNQIGWKGWHVLLDLPMLVWETFEWYFVFYNQSSFFSFLFEETKNHCVLLFCICVIFLGLYLLKSLNPFIICSPWVACFLGKCCYRNVEFLDPCLWFIFQTWTDVKLTSPQLSRVSMFKLSLRNLTLQPVSSR